MPWSASDADRHKKGLTAPQKKAWAEIANSALKEYGDEGRAIRTANAKAPQAKRATNYASEQAKAAKSKALSKVPKKNSSSRRK